MKKELLTRYIAIVTKGDSDVKTGASYYINEDEIKSTIEHGLRVYIKDMGTDGGQKWYPCKVQKLQYELKSIEDCGESSNNCITFSYYHHEYDWKEHWC